MTEKSHLVLTSGLHMYTHTHNEKDMVAINSKIESSPGEFCICNFLLNVHPVHCS